MDIPEKLREAISHLTRAKLALESVHAGSLAASVSELIDDVSAKIKAEERAAQNAADLFFNLRHDRRCE